MTTLALVKPPALSASDQHCLPDTHCMLEKLTLVSDAGAVAGAAAAVTVDAPETAPWTPEAAEALKALKPPVVAEGGLA